MSVVITRLNPFEVREVLQGEYTHYYPLTEEVSIPLKSGRCCKNGLDHLAAAGESLNPFEVREVLQGGKQEARSRLRLNPFEVREVLQACYSSSLVPSAMSQSL